MSRKTTNKPSATSKVCCYVLASLFLIIGSSTTLLGQFGDGLPQEAQKAIEHSILRLESQGAMATRAGLEEALGPRKLTTFLDGAVVKLTLMPDGTFEAESREGGSLVSFKLGKAIVDTSGEPISDAGWNRTTGSFELPKRQQKIALQMQAGARDVSVDCHNKYRRTDGPVTFFVGPLDGLFCLGLADAGEDQVAP